MSKVARDVLLLTLKVTVDAFWNLDDSSIVDVTSRWLEKEEGLLWNSISQLFCVVCIVATDASTPQALSSLFLTLPCHHSRYNLAPIRAKRRGHDANDLVEETLNLTALS